MNARKLLSMLVLLVALGAYLYFVELPKDQAEAEKKKLFTFDKEAVSEVVITYPDRSLSLKKNDTGKWQITQPVVTEADDATVNNLVAALVDAEVKRTLEETPHDLSVYGLNTPAVKVKVSLKDGKPVPLVSIGKDTPVGFSVYVQKEGDAKILLVPQAVRLGMTKEVKDLRDKTILSFDENVVKRVTIHGADSEVVLNKAEAGWAIEKPISAKADETEVRTFLSNLRSLQAMDFVEQPVLEMKEFGLAPAQLTISLISGEETIPKTILLGGEKTTDQGAKQRYLKRGDKDLLFLVGDWVLRDLNKTAVDFRDKTVASFVTEQVAKVEVQRQDGNGFTATRTSDKKWTLDKSQEGTFKEASVPQFLADLHELKGFEIAAEGPTDLSLYGIDQPVMTTTLSDNAGKKLAVVRFGQKTEGETKKSFAMTEGSQTVFGIRDYVFDRLNKTANDFWEKPAGKQDAVTPMPVSPPPSEETVSEQSGG